MKYIVKSDEKRIGNYERDILKSNKEWESSQSVAKRFKIEWFTMDIHLVRVAFAAKREKAI